MPIQDEWRAPKEEREKVAVEMYGRFPFRVEKAYGEPVVYALVQIFYADNMSKIREEVLNSDANLHGIMHSLGEYLEERADVEGVTVDEWDFEVRMRPASEVKDEDGFFYMRNMPDKVEITEDPEDAA